MEATGDKVRFAKGVTINTGNYQSVRLDLERETEVRPGESADDAYARVKGYVEGKLEEEEAIVRDKIRRR